MTPESARLVFDAMTFIIACSAGIYAWVANRRRASRAAMAELEKRLIVLETRVEGVASRESLHKLSLVVCEIEGDLKAMVARMNGMEDVMKRIEIVVNRQEDFLLNRGEAK